MLAARGVYRMFTDADGATPIAEVKRLEPALLAGADVVIGSRVLVDPSVSVAALPHRVAAGRVLDRKSTRLNSSHTVISYAVFCLKKKKKKKRQIIHL